jgi:uncharacterized protein YegP (UPF0339 family)
MGYGPRFDVYKDAAGYYRWRLVAGNGEKIASSGEWFATEWGAKNAAQTVINTCKQNPPIV